jgi:DNA-binding response OmpR family regulator
MEQNDILILVIDDDTDILKVISANLKLEGYDVITAETGLEAYDLISGANPDIIILDLNLPDIDGIQLCNKIRKENMDIPVIMLTARDAVSDKVLGLECGADDYIVKPFNFLELSARIKSCLRRYNFKDNKLNSKDVVNIKSLTIYPQKREAYINNEKINLTRTEFNLLMFLIENSDRICSRNEIKENLWKGKDIYNWSRTIDVHINHLRKKLKNHVVIESAPGIGYILKNNESV